jgi:toxin ParE1/3/4
MGWTIRLSAQAEEDMRSILVWTGNNFGPVQAGVYAMTLSLALEALLGGPEILGVKIRHELGADIRTLHVARQGRNGRHMIVFRISTSTVIDVLRILHDSMDLPRHIATMDEENATEIDESIT